MDFSKTRQITFLLIFFCWSIVTYTKVCAQHFATTRTDEGVEIFENGKKVLFYQQQPKSLNGEYERGGYLHPYTI
jgi:hypothetical protein